MERKKPINPISLLKRPEHIPQRAKFPVIDAHNHLFGATAPEQLVSMMDEVGISTFINVSANALLPFDGQGYTIQRCDIREFLRDYVLAYPGRFAAFTMSAFAQWDDFQLFKDDRFVDRAIQQMEDHVNLGACGLKVTKELGLRFTDHTGKLLAVDDERLYPIWRRAGKLKIPVLIHTSDPAAFFLPFDESNEHYQTLSEFPGWSFYGSFYSKAELLAQRNRLIGRHPETTFICPHVANNPEDLDQVSAFLKEFPNTYIDFSARIDELGRQPYSARDFMIEFQDRILFGIDMTPSAEAYRIYFRFLETRDEYFDYSDYLGRQGRCRWKIYGLYLPDAVLRKIYHENALRAIPRLQLTEA